MTERMQIYKCEKCDNIVEVVHGGIGELVCCGQTMKLSAENTVDAAKEKHVPVIEKEEEAVKVKVGSVPHPMEEDHYIEWIEVIGGDDSCRRFLKPGDKAEAEFSAGTEVGYAREYCNKHGLWKGE